MSERKRKKMRREKEDEKNLQHKYKRRRRGDDASRERMKELIQKQDEAISLMLEQREGMRQHKKPTTNFFALSSVLLLCTSCFMNE